MPFFSNRIQQVKLLVARFRKGRPAEPQDTENLQWFRRTLGLKRDITDYSPRSQRRIFQRLEEGATSAKDIYRREYQARKTASEVAREEHGMTASQWSRIRPLRDKLASYGMDVDPYMDDEVLKDFAQLYGYEYLRTVLSEQLDSVASYLAGDSGPGNRRWNARGAIEARFGASPYVYYVRGTDPYYFYHGRRS